MRIATAAAPLLAALLATAPVPTPASADTVLAEPPPSLDAPRRIVLQLGSDRPADMNNVLYNAVNLQKFYGQDLVQVAVVAYGGGMQALYRDTSPVAERVSSLLRYDVEFVACANTMEATHHTAGELIEGVEVVTAGLAEVVERQLRGWVVVRP